MYPFYLLLGCQLSINICKLPILNQPFDLTWFMKAHSGGLVKCLLMIISCHPCPIFALQFVLLRELVSFVAHQQFVALATLLSFFTCGFTCFLSLPLLHQIGLMLATYLGNHTIVYSGSPSPINANPTPKLEPF